MQTSMPFETDIPVINENYHDFNPTYAGFSQCAPKHTAPQHVNSDFLIHYVVSGKGTLIIDNKTFFIDAGNIFIIHPHKKYTYTADAENPWYYIWIAFNGNLAKNFFSMDYVYKFDEPQLFYNIKNSINITQYRTEYLYAQLLLIYCKLAPTIKDDISYAHIIRHQICSTYMTHINVNTLADYCNIHRNYATKLFKKEFGITISQFITQYRMQKATEFLSQGYTVETVAHYVGYDDYSNFSRKFKKFFGTSPSKYKHQLLSANLNTETYIPQGGKNHFTK